MLEGSKDTEGILDKEPIRPVEVEEPV